MLVKNAMSRAVHKLSPNDSFDKIIHLLVKHKISGAPVVNKHGKVIGIVSEKDLFYKLFPSEKVFYQDPDFYMNFDRIEQEASKVRKLKAKHFMSRNIIYVEPDDHILKACSLFIVHKIRRMPVLDEGKLVGLVTTNDIYKRFLSVLADAK